MDSQQVWAPPSSTPQLWDYGHKHLCLDLKWIRRIKCRSSCSHTLFTARPLQMDHLNVSTVKLPSISGVDYGKDTCSVTWRGHQQWCSKNGDPGRGRLLVPTDSPSAPPTEGRQRPPCFSTSCISRWKWSLIFFSHLIVFHIEEVQRGLGSSSQTILETNSMPDSQVSKYLWLARRDSVAVACCSHLGRSVHAETDTQRNQLSFLSGHLTLASEAPAGLCFPCSRLGPPHFYLPNTNKPSAMYVKCYWKPEGGGELQNPSSRGNEWDFTTFQPMDTHIWWKKQNKTKVWKSRIVQALDSVLCQV